MKTPFEVEEYFKNGWRNTPYKADFVLAEDPKKPVILI
jgi:hypothetical protein